MYMSIVSSHIYAADSIIRFSSEAQSSKLKQTCTTYFKLEKNTCMGIFIPYI